MSSGSPAWISGLWAGEEEIEITFGEVRFGELEFGRGEVPPGTGEESRMPLNMADSEVGDFTLMVTFAGRVWSGVVSISEAGTAGGVATAGAEAETAVAASMEMIGPKPLPLSRRGLFWTR